MVGRKMRVIVMARSESTTDLPEQKDWKKPGPDDRRLTRDEREHYEERIGRLTDKEYWDRRAGGMGGNPTSCAEENLLGYPGTRYFGENILVHEFAHGIMDIGIRRADPELLRKIRDAYKAAMDKGLWKGHYASTNANEYWAEGTQTWFWSNYEYKDGETTVMTPDDLKGYDPTLYDLLSQVYADHHIPMDVYHAKGLRRAAEGQLLRNPVGAKLLGRTSDGGAGFRAGLAGRRARTRRSAPHWSAHVYAGVGEEWTDRVWTLSVIPPGDDLMKFDERRLLRFGNGSRPVGMAVAVRAIRPSRQILPGSRKRRLESPLSACRRCISTGCSRRCVRPHATW